MLLLAMRTNLTDDNPDPSPLADVPLPFAPTPESTPITHSTKNSQTLLVAARSDARDTKVRLHEELATNAKTIKRLQARNQEIEEALEKTDALIRDYNYSLATLRLNDNARPDESLTRSARIEKILDAPDEKLPDMLDI